MLELHWIQYVVHLYALLLSEARMHVQQECAHLQVFAHTIWEADLHILQACGPV